MPRMAAVLGAAAGLAPDLDIFIPTFGDPTASWYWHRGPTHALLIVPLGALLCLLPFLLFKGVRDHKVTAYLACLIGYATHAPLDALTSYGTMLFWPFSDYRVALDLMPIIDPIWTLTLLVGVIIAAVRKSVVPSRAVLAFGLLYFGFAAIQNHRAVEATIAMGRERGHDPQRVRAMPAPLAPLVWRGLYEHDGQAWAVGVRTGYLGQTTVKPGESRHLARIEEVADSAEDRHHFERFNWFADGYAVILDTGRPMAVVDGRYSAAPAGFESLWGLDFSTEVPRRYSPPLSLNRAMILDTILGRDESYVPFK